MLDTDFLAAAEVAGFCQRAANSPGNTAHWHVRPDSAADVRWESRALRRASSA